MITTLIIVCLAFLGLFFMVTLSKGRASSSAVLENPAAHIQSVDVEAFRNLVDPREKEFLRSRLRPAEFRRIQRERLRAAAEYVSGAAANAAILMRIAQAARRSPDAATAEAAEKLANDAIHLRRFAFRALAQIYVGIIIPSARISPAGVAEGYEQLTRRVVMLGLQYPTRGVSSAL